MEAVHVSTHGMYCDRCTRAVERALDDVEGIEASIAVKSLDVVSVLYEPMTVSPETIEETIRAAGFEARVVRDLDRARTR